MTSWLARFAELDRWDPDFGRAQDRQAWRWPVRTLRDVAEVRLGTQLRTDPGVGTTFPYLRAANVQRGYLDLADVKRMPVTSAQAERLLLQEDDILFVEGNSFEEVGRAARWPGGDPIIIQNSLVRVRLTTSELNPDFVVLWFNSTLGGEYVRQHATTTSGSLWHIGAGKLEAAPLPVPPLSVQKELIDEHTTVVALANDAERSRTQQEEAAWSHFATTLIRPAQGAEENRLTRVVRFADLDRWDETGHFAELDALWPVSTLGEISQIRLGVQVPRRNSAPAGPARPYLRAANIRRGYVDTSDVKDMHVSERQAQSLELTAGDLLFAEGSGSPREVGRCAVWDGSIPGIIHQNSVVRARLADSALDREFIVTWFNSPAGNEYIRRQATTTSGLYHIGAGKLAAAPLPRPPREIQRSAVSRLKSELKEAGRLADRSAVLKKEAETLVGMKILLSPSSAQ